MRCSPERLSAYADGGLDRSERRLLEAHLAHCGTCAARLADYRRLDRGLSTLPALTAPADLELAVRARAARVNAPAGRSAPAFGSLAAAAFFAMLAVVVLSRWGPFGLNRVATVSVAEANFTDLSYGAIEVRFDGQIDRGKIERGVQLSPPVPARMSWRDNTLMIVPERSEISGTLTVAIDNAQTATGAPFRAVIPPPGAPTGEAVAKSQATGADASGAATMAAATPDPAALLALATRVAVVLADYQASQATAQAATPTPVPSSGFVPLGQATAPDGGGSAAAGALPSATGLAAFAAASSAAGSACDPAIGRSFGDLLRSQAGLGERLGCALTSERAAPMSVQPFERGMLLLRGDQHLIFNFVTTNRLWTVQMDTWREGDPLPQTAASPAGLFVPTGALGKAWRDRGVSQTLGWATGSERRFVGQVQDFQRGILFLDEQRRSYVLFPEGAYQTFEPR